MNLRDLAAFFVGNRQSIERIAASPWSLLVGGLFVLSAGFAREYDGEDLLSEPWHLLLPLVASLGTSLLLYGVLSLAVQHHAASDFSGAAMYRRFLSLYWMTAPLAWLYAIPVEQFTTPAQATRINLAILALVALWRVGLITRCASVLFGTTYRAMFPLVMLFADAVLLVILWFTPMPVLNIMGGIRLTESERIIQDATFTMGFLGVVTLPVWLVASTVVVGSSKRNWQVAIGDAKPISRGVWAVAACSLLVWCLVLPYTQPPRHLASIVEQDLLNGQIRQALQRMDERQRDDFPAHWDPPPWPGYRQDNPPLIEVLEALNDAASPAWVRDIYVQKLVQKIGTDYGTFSFLAYMELEQFARYLQILEQTPELHDLVREHASTFKWLAETDNTSAEERERLIRDFLKSLGIEHQPLEQESGNES